MRQGRADQAEGRLDVDRPHGVEVVLGALREVRRARRMPGVVDERVELPEARDRRPRPRARRWLDRSRRSGRRQAARRGAAESARPASRSRRPSDSSPPVRQQPVRVIAAPIAPARRPTPSRPSSEEPLIHAAVVDDVLPRHEARLRRHRDRRRGRRIPTGSAKRPAGQVSIRFCHDRLVGRVQRAWHARAGWCAARRCRRGPGRRVLIVTLCGISSRTIAAIAPDSASRAAWECAKPTCGNLMKLTDMLTIRPNAARVHARGQRAWISSTDE